MLHTYHANALGVLLEQLGARIGAGLADPFAPETIVVPNQGMARWVSQELALRAGIAANLAFPLPATFFWETLTAWLPGAPDQDAYQRGTLAWHIFRLLPGLIDTPAFADLRRYLDTEASDLRRFELATQLADLFDQYLIYRHDLCLAFESTADSADWQAVLWRAVASDIHSAHRAALVAAFEDALARGEGPRRALPQRVSLFGIGTLAPVQVRLLDGLARHTEVDLYYLNPCREYWADVEDPRRLARRRARARRAGLPDPTGMLDIGNPLLASLGHAGQIFLDQLLELGGVDTDLFVAPEGEHLLARLQRDILDLADRRTPDAAARMPLRPGDLSLRVHGAHGPLREVQVLQERLLDLFEALPGLEPRDIVVMAPDMDLYAPYVAAVFGTAEDALRIPWSLADRRPGAEQALAQTIDLLLGLPHARLAATEVLALLAVPALRRRFGISEATAARLAQWISGAGVRWGLDGGARAELGLPSEPANTWAFGLDRLFLGYAMPAQWADAPCLGVLPYADIEPGEAEALGALQSLLDALSEWRRRLGVARTAGDWAETLNALLEAFLEASDDAELAVLECVRATLAQTRERQRLAGVEAPVSGELIAALVRAALEEPSGAQGFLNGRVTFANMVPMRSIPHRVIALLGLNADAFPRAQRPLSFDRIAREPRRGDRSRRRDDRYLFLECLLAARDAVHVSWSAHSPRDNSARQPSVVLEELLDYIDAAFDCPGHARPRDVLVVHHPLQPFSPAHFDGVRPALASHSPRWCAAARAAFEATCPPFLATPLPPPDAAARRVEVAALGYFLRDPAAHFLRARLGLRLPRREEAQADEEAFAVAPGLERYALRRALLAQRDLGQDAAQVQASLRAAGTLPHGAPGDLVLADELVGVDALIARRARFAGTPMTPLEVDLVLGPFRLQGVLRGHSDQGLVLARPARLKPKDRLAAWLPHLLLCALAPPGVLRRTVCLAEDQTLILSAVEDPRAVLAALLARYWEGLTRPVPFFPATSHAWFESGGARDLEAPWSGGRHEPGEGEALAVRIAWRGSEPLGAAFQACASEVYAPLAAVSTLHKAGEEP